MCARFLRRAVASYQVVSDKTTGSLSGITSFANVAGTIARIFTTMQETEDQLLLVSAVVACAMNVMVLSLFFVYPGVSKGAKGAKNE
jgi:mannose-P-dolichol utilization defect protein 1